jgi:hypothetical protein
VKAEHFSPDVQQFMRILAKHGVRYLLVGGTAVIYHGYARLTGDTDFFYDCEAENAARLWQALLEFWDGNVPAVEGSNELTQGDLVVQFGRPPNRIDLIAGMGSVVFEDAWANRVEESILVGEEQVPVAILSLEHLRRAKTEAGRPKDLDDLEHLPSPG